MKRRGLRTNEHRPGIVTPAASLVNLVSDGSSASLMALLGMTSNPAAPLAAANTGASLEGSDSKVFILALPNIAPARLGPIVVGVI